MFFKPRDTKSSIGIDIGSSSIKVVELIKRSAQIEVLNFSKAPLSHTISASNAIKQAIKEARITSKFANTSVSGKSVVVRYITLPAMTSEELKSALTYEAEKHIPFSVQDVILDFQIIETDSAEHKIKVILVAAKKDLIRYIIKLLEECELTPAVIDIDSFAVAKAFHTNFNFEKNNAYVLINIGAKVSNISIMSKDISYLTRDLEIAGNAITRYLSDKLRIPFDEAERFKCNPKDNDTAVEEAVGYALEGLFNELKLSQDYYESHFEKPIEAVFLSGGTSLIKNIDKIFTNALGVETKLWNPLKHIRTSKSILNRGLLDSAGQFAVSMGLALRGM
ncbi:MAG: type IV pilus assembly protein PilM [Candidatus Omnitrophota bacterium]